MAERLDENLGAVGFDNLIHSVNPPAEVFSVKVRKLSAAATYKRGTVLALSGGTAGDGEMVILGTSAASNETLTANCILADDVEVGTSAAAVAVAYRTGHFNENGLVMASGHALTAAEKEDLRKVGILISDAVAY